MRAVTAQTLDPDPVAAAAELAEAVRAGGIGNPLVAMLFVSPDLRREVLVAELTRLWPELPVVGCSSDGTSSDQRGYFGASAVLAAFAAPDACVRVGVCHDISRDPYQSVERGWNELQHAPSPDPACALLFADPFAICGDLVLDAFYDATGLECPVFGGLAAGGRGLGIPFVVYRGKVLRDAAVFAVVEGVTQASAIDSGWRSFSDTAVVTRSTGRHVFLIGDEPALQWYERYSPTNGVVRHPVAIRSVPTGTGASLGLRAPLAARPDRSIVFTGAAPEGAIVSLATARRNDVQQAAESAAQAARRAYSDSTGPELALFFSCSARAHLLGTRAVSELDVMEAECGCGTPVAGAYLRGEFAVPAYTLGTRSQFHNEAIVPVLLGEASA